MPNRYNVTFLYTYEDAEHVEVIADSECEAQRLAEDERSGPNHEWNHASLTMDDVWSVDEVESDITEEVDA